MSTPRKAEFTAAPKRKVLATIGVGPMAPVLELASQTFSAYATRHGYDLVAGEGSSQGRPAAWGKVLLARQLLDVYDEVLWIDADAIILDGSVDVASVVPLDRFQAMARPPGEFVPDMLNTGVWFLRGARASAFLDRVWEQEQWVDHAWWEQMAVLDVLGFDGKGRLVRETEWLEGTAWLPTEWNVMEWQSGLVPARIRHYANRPNDFRTERMRIDLQAMQHPWRGWWRDLRWRRQQPDYKLRRMRDVPAGTLLLRVRAKGLHELRRLERRTVRPAKDLLKRNTPAGVRRCMQRALRRISRRRREQHQWSEFRRCLRSRGKVLYGPFAGLDYGSESSWGSPLPLLVGSYEAELHAVLEELLRVSYDCVIDVGCAEGYYAVGLARLLPSARVFAFDVDERARAMCAAMAQRNRVDERVRVSSVCTPEILSDLIDGRTLLICDCEGCELDLLDPVRTPKLRDADMIIELHDFVDPSISTVLVERFADSHDVRLISARRPVPENYPALDMLSPSDRHRALDEHRPWKTGPMQWAVCRSR